MKPLWLLLRLRNRAILRQFRNGMKTVKGMLLMVMTVAIIAMVCLPNLFLRLSQSSSTVSSYSMLSNYFPLVLFIYFVVNLLTSIGERAIYFSPAEINFLFSAPFSRRQLLIYKLTGVLGAAFFQGLVITFALVNLIPSLLFGFVGAVLTTSFMSLTSILITLIGQVVNQKIYTRSKRLIGLAMVGLIAVAIGQASSTIVADTDLMSWAEQICNSTAGKIVLAPFMVFCETFFASSFSQFFFWMPIALLINFGLLAAILSLDANYSESADRISQKIQTKVDAVKNTGGWAGRARKGKLNIPIFAFYGGAGPLIWRQLVNFLRTSRSLLIFGGVGCAGLCIPIYFSFRGKIGDGFPLLGLVFAGIAYISALISLNLPMGFRAETNLIEHFKSLPIKPLPVAIGQIFGSVITLCFLQWIVIFFAVVASQFLSLWWIAGGLATIPFNVMIVCSANTLYLYFPIPSHSGNRGIQAVMQMIIFSIIHMLVIIAAAGIVAATFGLLFAVTNSLWLGYAAGLVVLTFISIFGVWNVSFAYDKFDVSSAPK